MGVNTSDIWSLSVEDREDALIDVARLLESTARDAAFVGEGKFPLLSTNMAEAIRANADELARDVPENADRVLKQAASMITQFKTAYPHRAVSLAMH